MENSQRPHMDVHNTENPIETTQNDNDIDTYIKKRTTSSYRHASLRSQLNWLKSMSSLYEYQALYLPLGS